MTRRMWGLSLAGCSFLTLAVSSVWHSLRFLRSSSLSEESHLYSIKGNASDSGIAQLTRLVSESMVEKGTKAIIITNVRHEAPMLRFIFSLLAAVNNRVALTMITDDLFCTHSEFIGALNNRSKRPLFSSFQNRPQRATRALILQMSASGQCEWQVPEIYTLSLPVFFFSKFTVRCCMPKKHHLGSLPAQSCRIGFVRMIGMLVSLIL